MRSQEVRRREQCPQSRFYRTLKSITRILPFAMNDVETVTVKAWYKAFKILATDKQDVCLLSLYLSDFGPALNNEHIRIDTVSVSGFGLYRLYILLPINQHVYCFNQSFNPSGETKLRSSDGQSAIQIPLYYGMCIHELFWIPSSVRASHNFSSIWQHCTPK